jgi:hypothetical protein
MFIYERNGRICVTFKDDKPVAAPEYEFVVDKEADTVTVNGKVLMPMITEELAENAVYDTARVISEPVSINLAGRMISAPEDTVGDGIFHVQENGYLIISGKGIVNGVGKNDYNMAIWADGGHVIIDDGTFTNKGAQGQGDSHFDLIYVKNGGTVEINGGYFECETPKWTLNSNNTKPGTIIVRGGTFVGFNPAEAYTDDNGAEAVNYLAPGYRAIKSGLNIWTVCKI